MLKVTLFFLTLFDLFGILHSCMNFPILFEQHIYLVLCEHSRFCWRSKTIQREFWCAPQFSFSFQKISCKILLSLNKDKPPVFLLIYVLVIGINLFKVTSLLPFFLLSWHPPYIYTFQFSKKIKRDVWFEPLFSFFLFPHLM